MHIQPRRRRGGNRLSFTVLLGVLGVGLCTASIAWACAPYEYGWNESKAPPAESPQPGQGGSSPAPAPPSGGSGPAASQPPPSSGPEGGTVNSPNSAPVQSPNSAPVQSPGRVPAQSPARQPAAQSPSGTAPQVNAPSGVSAPSTGTGSFSDEGVGAGSSIQSSGSGGTDRGGRKEGLQAGRSAAAQGPSAQSATGDLWSAFEADETSSLTPSGGDVAGADSGPGAGFGAGVALLGLGAAALLGGLALTGARRRRSVASTTDDG